MEKLSFNDIIDFFNGTIKLINEQKVDNEIFKRTLTKAGEINRNPNLNGFIAEICHEITFNNNAAKVNSPFKAKALIPEHGYTKNSVDIGIYENGIGRANKRYQLKYGKTAEETIRYIKNGDYRGQQLVVPSEQVEAVQKAFPDRKVSAVIEMDGVSSKPLSKAEAVEIQEHIQDGTYKDYQRKQLIKGTAAEMGKSGVMGLAINATVETVTLYKSYKNGDITGKEYLKEIAKAGGDGGVTGAATAGIMVPVTAGLSAIGAATAWVTIPVSFVLSAAVNKVVAPMFARGKYKKILNEAKYYQNMMEFHTDLVNALGNAAEQFGYFIEDYQSQLENHETLSRMNNYLRNEHKKANISIESKNKEIKDTMLDLADLYNKI